MCNVFGERAPLPRGGAQDNLGSLGCVAAVCAKIEYRNYGDHTHTHTTKCESSVTSNYTVHQPKGDQSTSDENRENGRIIVI